MFIQSGLIFWCFIFLYKKKPARAEKNFFLPDLLPHIKKFPLGVIQVFFTSFFLPFSTQEIPNFRPFLLLKWPQIRVFRAFLVENSYKLRFLGVKSLKWTQIRGFYSFFGRKQLQIKIFWFFFEKITFFFPTTFRGWFFFALENSNESSDHEPRKNEKLLWFLVNRQTKNF